jgi:EAL domain-containing protein (putative c-di-GMP-specific phosphodiesterase class I)
MARVTSDGCTDVQGYLISRPMPPKLIDGFLASRNERAEAAGGPALLDRQPGLL